MQNILTLLYSTAGLVGLSAYIPTFMDVWQGVPSANIRSWALWCVSSVCTVLYALVVTQDMPFTLMSLAHFISITTILALRLRLEYTKDT